MKKFPCVIMRGGTSKAVFFHQEDMPHNRDCWDAFLLDVMGNPDLTQIDGIGGASSFSNKVAIINPSLKENADVDYLFAQVSLNSPKVIWEANCGDISSAVGPFALDEGLMQSGEPQACVRIFNVNTGKTILAEFTVAPGPAKPEKLSEISGVPGRSAPVWLSFCQPHGATFGTILPTGKAVDRIMTSRGPLSLSIVDAAATWVFVLAKDLGLRGTELPEDFSTIQLSFLEEIRSRSAELCGVCPAGEASKQSPLVPYIAVLAPPSNHTTSAGILIPGETMDLSARMLSTQKPHRTGVVTGAVCIGAAAKLDGSLVQQLCPHAGKQLRIGHAEGVDDIEVNMEQQTVESVKVLRTARRIMEGTVYTKHEY